MTKDNGERRHAAGYIPPEPPPLAFDILELRSACEMLRKAAASGHRVSFGSTDWQQMEFKGAPQARTSDVAKASLSGFLSIFNRTSGIEWRILKRARRPVSWWRKVQPEFAVYCSPGHGIYYPVGRFENLPRCLEQIYHLTAPSRPERVYL